MANDPSASQMIRCGLSQAFHNKINVTGRQAAFGDSFIPSEVTIEELVQHILSGKAFTLGYFKGRHRNRKSFVSSQLMALDFDHDVSVQQALADPFISAYAFLVYPTPSSTIEHPRSRVLFQLSEPVYEWQRWEAMQDGLIQHFADWQPDKACKDAARLFYGSDLPGAVELAGNILPLEIAGSLTLDNALQDNQRKIQRQEKMQRRQDSRAERLNRPHAEAYAAAALNRIVRDYEAVPGGVGQRHHAFIAFATSLCGKDKGGWPGFSHWETIARDLGGRTERTPNEIENAIKWAALNAAPDPFVLPPPPKHKNADKDKPPAWPPQLPPVKLEPFPADIQVNSRYLSNAPFPKEWTTLAIKSPLGTGKTQFVINHINQHQPQRVRLVTFLQALTQNIEKRFNGDIQGRLFEHYQGIPGNYDLSLIDRLICTLNSLVRMSHTEEGYDLVVIDEFEQVIRALWDGTLKNPEIVPVFCTFVDILTRAKQVIIADAHLSAESIAFLRDVCHRDVTAVENTYQPPWPKMKIFEELSNLIVSAIECADAYPDQPVIFTTSSRKDARTCHRLFAERYGVDRVKLVYGWNSHEDPVRHFVADINEELPKLRILITTPSLGVGIDVQCPVAGVFGYFPGKHIAPTGFLQQMARYRKAKHFAVVIPLVHRHAPEEPAKLKYWEQFKCRETQKLAGVSDILTEKQLQLTRLWGSYTALHNRLTNEALATFVALAEKEGFQIEWVSGSSKSMKATLKAAHKAYQDQDDFLTLTLPAVSPDEFEDKRRKKKLCENDYLALRRWQLEDITKQSITDKLLKRYSRKAKLDALIRLTLYDFGGEEGACKVDRQESDRLPFKRHHMMLQLRFFAQLLFLVFGDRGLQNTEELTEDEIVRRVGPYLAANPETILALDNQRSDLSSDPFKTFCRILSRWHVKLSYRQVRINDDRPYLYRINQERLAVYRADALVRWEGLSQNVGKSNATIRDLSKESPLVAYEGEGEAHPAQKRREYAAYASASP